MCLRKFFIYFVVALVAGVCFSSCDSNADNQLKSSLVAVNSQCPLQVDEVTTMEKVTVDDSNMIYHMTIAPTVTIESPTEFIEQMKAYTKEGLKSQMGTVGGMLGLLEKTGRGLRYQYTFTSDGQIINVDFTPEEVAKLMQQQ